VLRLPPVVALGRAEVACGSMRSDTRSVLWFERAVQSVSRPSALEQIRDVVATLRTVVTHAYWTATQML